MPTKTTPAAPKRKPGRPVTTGTTPVSARQQKHVHALKASGGKRIVADAPAESLDQLRAIMQAKDFTEKAAILWSLSVAAKKIR